LPKTFTSGRDDWQNVQTTGNVNPQVRGIARMAADPIDKGEGSRSALTSMATKWARPRRWVIAGVLLMLGIAAAHFWPSVKLLATISLVAEDEYPNGLPQFDSPDRLHLDKLMLLAKNSPEPLAALLSIPSERCRAVVCQVLASEQVDRRPAKWAWVTVRLAHSAMCDKSGAVRRLAAEALARAPAFSTVQGQRIIDMAADTASAWDREDVFRLLAQRLPTTNRAQRLATSNNDPIVRQATDFLARTPTGIHILVTLALDGPIPRCLAALEHLLAAQRSVKSAGPNQLIPIVSQGRGRIGALLGGQPAGHPRSGR
jgi:hypothetical protein